MKRLFITIGVICIVINSNINAQTENSSYVFIPIKVQNSEIRKLINSSTPPSIQLKDKTDTKRYDITLKISDGNTNFNGNKITHNIRFTDGSGTYGSRGWTKQPWPFKGKIWGAWVTLGCDNIRGNASANISTIISSDYNISTNSNFSAKIDNAKCEGVNVTSLLRAFGWHHFSDNISGQINQELKKIPFKSEIEKIWKNIQKPISIDSTTFILIEPKNLIYKDFMFDNSNLNLGVGIKFNAKTGNKEEANNWIPNKNLPNLEKISDLPQNNIDLNIPLKIEFQTIEKKAKENLIGQYIKVKNKKGKEKKYAKILDVTINNSSIDKYDLKLGLKVKILRPLFKRKKGFIYLHSKMVFDKSNETLYVDKFKIDAQTNSWLANNSIEALANFIVYNRLKRKMSFDLDKKLDEQKIKLNKVLESKIEISKGLNLSGVINDLDINEIKPLDSSLFLSFVFKGNMNVNILEINR